MLANASSFGSAVIIVVAIADLSGVANLRWVLHIQYRVAGTTVDGWTCARLLNQLGLTCCSCPSSAYTNTYLPQHGTRPAEKSAVPTRAHSPTTARHFAPFANRELDTRPPTRCTRTAACPISTATTFCARLEHSAPRQNCHPGTLQVF